MAWFWLILGILLMLAELLTPGFVIFFFGLAAATVSALVALVPGFSAYWQLGAFTVLSIVYLAGLRRAVKPLFASDGEKSEKLRDELVGRIGKVVAPIRPDVPGRVLVGDAEWTATAASAIPEGADIRVVARDNLTVSVETI